MQSTALVAHEVDDSLPGHRELRAALEHRAEIRFAVGDDPHTAARRLEIIGRSQLLFDQGEVATAHVEGVRATASRVAAFVRGLDLPPDEGRVSACDDADSLRMQIADVAAGYAAARLAERGFRGLQAEFRLVVVNGQRLLPEDAERLDRERAEFAKLV
jgi:hypothetical protein